MNLLRLAALYLALSYSNAAPIQFDNDNSYFQLLLARNPSAFLLSSDCCSMPVQQFPDFTAASYTAVMASAPATYDPYAAAPMIIPQAEFFQMPALQPQAIQFANADQMMMAGAAMGPSIFDFPPPPVFTFNPTPAFNLAFVNAPTVILPGPVSLGFNSGFDLGALEAPEPSTGALVLGALGLVCWLRKRLA